MTRWRGDDPARTLLFFRFYRRQKLGLRVDYTSRAFRPEAALTARKVTSRIDVSRVFLGQWCTPHVIYLRCASSMRA